MDYLQMKTVTAKSTVPLIGDAFQKINRTAIYWLAGAGFLINARGTLAMIDPLLKTTPGHPELCETGAVLKVNYPIDADDVPKLDAVLYTHSDDDHLAELTAKSLSHLNPKLIGPPPVFEKLARMRIDVDLLISCRSKEELHFQNMRIEVFPADHPWQLQDPLRLGKPFREGDAVGFIIETPDVLCFFPGDTRLMEEHLYMKGIQFLALDVSLCTYHINPQGARNLANILKDAYLMPYHYGTFDLPDVPAFCGDPATVLDEVTNGYQRAIITAPGQSVIFEKGQLVDPVH